MPNRSRELVLRLVNPGEQLGRAVVEIDDLEPLLLLLWPRIGRWRIDMRPLVFRLLFQVLRSSRIARPRSRTEGHQHEQDDQPQPHFFAVVDEQGFEVDVLQFFHDSFPLLDKRGATSNKFPAIIR